MGWRPPSPWALYPPRHAQPGIHEYIAQTLQTWAPIKYCPWCGVELGRFYRKTWAALHDESELSGLQRRAN